jgi:catechol 2,3-dioxygenase-like lactoylglutathione lyase family enzyme
MGKIRHIAIRCEDPDKTAQWLQDALELQLVPWRGSAAIDLSDGDVFYEAKFKYPEGLVVDGGHWAGTSPIPETVPSQVAVRAGKLR